MKKPRRSAHIVFFIVFMGLFLNCNGDDKSEVIPVPTGKTKTFKLFSTADLDISGTVTFVENEDNLTTIRIKLNNTPAGGMHPALLHRFTGAEGGGIALSLGEVNGNNGESEITISKLDNGTIISYNELINFNGYINVVLSKTDTNTDIAQGDIGPNELTGQRVSYGFVPVNDSGVVGSISFEERVDGTSLVKLLVAGTSNGLYPTGIYENNVATGGEKTITLLPIMGEKSFGQTSVRMLDNGTGITYQDLLEYNGHIKIYDNQGNTDFPVAQGDIGANGEGTSN